MEPKNTSLEDDFPIERVDLFGSMLGFGGVDPLMAFEGL